jgi:processive 1,2-diacylglycerol beta-glucosyltransferase
MKGLILYLEIGHGFKSPAIAIQESLNDLGVESLALDAFSALNSNLIDKFFKKGWNTCLKHPFIFDIIYKLTDNKFRFLELALLPLFEKKILNQLKTINPDFIISTHFTTTFLYSLIIKKHKLNIPFFAFNGDAVTSHSYWVSNDLCNYYISTKEGYNSMIQCGQDPKKLTLSSFPIDKKFKKKFDSQKKERKKLGLNNNFTLLIVLGGMGIGNAREIIDKLEEKNIKIQIIVGCGRNEKLKKEITNLSLSLKNVNIKVLGFVNNMQDYLYCSDIVVGKSGLNFLFESIYFKKPFIVSMAMANEKFAAKYIVDNNLGFWPKDIEELVKKISLLKESKKELNQIKENIEKLKISFKTDRITKDVLTKTIRFKKNIL